MLSNLPKIVKKFLGKLPQSDYPVLTTFRFVSCWLNFAFDPSLMSMRDLFSRLNHQGIKIDISTFSKANKVRSTEVFKDLLRQLIKEINQKYKSDKLALFPLDSTTITLTTKLLWSQGIHQVKLFSGLNLVTSEVSGVSLHFGEGHDSKYGNETVRSIPENGVGIMDRGFSSQDRIRELCDNQQYFVMRLKNNQKLKILENDQCCLGAKESVLGIRVIAFCDLEKKTEYRLATNLPSSGKHGITNEEIGEIYRKRWGIELLWKFLKMHLKLDRIITKNQNGIEIQIYTSLIAYFLLNLIEIPKELGNKLLDKFRYLQAVMCEQINYIYWFEQLIFTG